MKKLPVVSCQFSVEPNPELNRVYQGDCVAVMRGWPDGFVDCCVTSPPYWGLRDYGTPGQLGLEPTPEAYVAKLVEVFREVRRVLKPSGTLWLNLGDSYAAMLRSGRKESPGVGAKQQIDPLRTAVKWHAGDGSKFRWMLPGGQKPKDLVGIPWMVAFALRADGWYLRKDIIWAKPNPMPESVEDRPTSSHEYIMLLSPQGDNTCWRHEETRAWTLWPDPQPPPDYRWRHRDTREVVAAEPAPDYRWIGPVRGQESATEVAGWRRVNLWRRWDCWHSFDYYYDADAIREPASQWTVERAQQGTGTARCSPTSKSATADKSMALGGSKARLGRDYKLDAERGVNARDVWNIATEPYPGAHFATFPTEIPRRCILAGCPHGGLVLDPFLGSGTVGLVAEQLGRQWLGIDLSPDYCQMARRRTQQAGIFAGAR